MITVKRKCNGVTITGHANYARRGEDIVCAAVSTLVQTLIVSIEKLTDDEIKYDIQSGLVEISHGNLSEKSKTLLNSFFVGIEMIATEYPNCVTIV